jgi:membrane-bound ClpP family serine protease
LKAGVKYFEGVEMEGSTSIFLSLFCVIGVLALMMFVMMSAAIRIVPESKRLDVYRLGRYIGEKGPGLVLIIPVIDRGALKEVGESTLTRNRTLIGTAGETQTSVYTDGKVRLSTGEVWDAISQKPLSPGQRVRVVRALLEVEKEEG